SDPVNTGPTLSGAWIRALPTGSGMTAGFGTLRNPGQTAIQIVSFSSPSFGEVSLHRTELVDGVSKMREVPSLSIDAGSSIVLEPGGYHLMLMMPVGEIQPGHTVTIEMAAADGRSFSFVVPVERR
ncbi:MAG: copper chaperone PCu(A)C, partial [Xanthomonadales bacterium]|nr:copper chaperone PCu(A)C [Xanthomonadales bacterium]